MGLYLEFVLHFKIFRVSTTGAGDIGIEKKRNGMRNNGGIVVVVVVVDVGDITAYT